MKEVLILRKWLLLSFLLSLSSCASDSSTSSVGKEFEKPNVVIIFTDDQGYGDVGVYGAKGYETPRLDQLATRGIRFTDFYVAAPVCTPSRAALMTGSYPKRLSLAHRVLFPFSEHGLNPDETTLAELLQSSGYSTAIIGKWHLGHHPEFLPGNQGFDYFYGIPYSNDMGNHHYSGRDYTSPPLPIMRNGRTIEVDPPQSSLTRRFTEESVQFIRDHSDAPFFLYLAHSMPHLPIDASPEFKGKTEHGLYGDVIEEIDWSVGQILDTIAELDLERKTLIIFTSDNGPVIRPEEQLGHQPGSAGPLRGHKNTTWEGGMRVPCIVSWPGKIPSGIVSDEVVTVMDFFPTLAALIDTPLPENRIIDGKDISKIILGNGEAESPHEAFFYYRDSRLQAVRSREWKLHVYRPEWEGDPQDFSPLLYNLAEDVGETRDVAAENPTVVERLLRYAESARQELGDAVTGEEGLNVRPAGQLPATRQP